MQVQILSVNTEIVNFDVQQWVAEPYKINVIGNLVQAGTAIGIDGEFVNLKIDDVDYGNRTTYTPYPPSPKGYFAFNEIILPAGSHTVQVIYNGNTTYGYNPCQSTIASILTQILTTLTCSVNPTSGAPPLTVTISGALTRSLDGIGVAAKPIDIYVDNVKISTVNTDDVGNYSTTLTFETVGNHSIYAEFTGDTEYEGC